LLGKSWAYKNLAGGVVALSILAKNGHPIRMVVPSDEPERGISHIVVMSRRLSTRQKNYLPRPNKLPDALFSNAVASVFPFEGSSPVDPRLRSSGASRDGPRARRAFSVLDVLRGIRFWLPIRISTCRAGELSGVKCAFTQKRGWGVPTASGWHRPKFKLVLDQNGCRIWPPR
jgi:hypothetical protein